MLSKQGLMRIKAGALRRKAWFKALSRSERGVIDLTLRCVERIRSRILMRTVLAIADKLLKTLEESFLEKVERAGLEIVRIVCAIAWKWGNPRGSLWRYDTNFVRFLGTSAASKQTNLGGCIG